MKQFPGLILGLAVGIIGAVLFMQSLPPEEGSFEESTEQLTVALKKANMRIAAFEAEGRSDKPRRTIRDGMRSIAEDIKAGRDVDLDDVFDAAKPWLRDMAPIFDRIRVRDQKKHFDTLTGQLTRKYDLTEAQQEELEEWLDRKAEENAQAFSDVVGNEKSGLEDLIRSTRDMRIDRDLDAFMESTLSGETLTAYQTDRMHERVNNVQQEADRKVTRLNQVVLLDEKQKDEVFGIMVRGSDDYDPSMRIEGVEGDTAALVPGQSRNDAILSVLRPAQRQTLENHRQQERWRAERDLREVGLSLPADWDLFDDDDF